MGFEADVRDRMAILSNELGMNVVIDGVETFRGPSTDSLLVEFHLEGIGVSPARFTFPFAEAVPLDATVEALRDLIERNGEIAHLPPPVAANFNANSGAAGGAF